MCTISIAYVCYQDDGRSGPCGTLDEGHCRSGAGGDGVHGGNNIYWRQMDTGRTNGRTEGGWEGGTGESPTLLCTSNGRNYENLFLPLSRPIAIALERCEVRCTLLRVLCWSSPPARAYVFVPSFLPSFRSSAAPSHPTNLVRRNIKAVTNVARSSGRALASLPRPLFQSKAASPRLTD